MNYRRFNSGDCFRLSGVNFRVINGSKAGNGKQPANDLVIQWSINGQWISIGFDVVALLVDFLYENEDELYPPPGHHNAHEWTNYKGGNYVRDFISKAIKHGHTHAIQQLEFEKTNRATLFDGAGV